ncbi:thioredoxin domain-containing protein [Egibacter rhizosphaerae]|uniref:Thioredoxin domain-containing protein n=1 Tax=Egibacter rhizosphaerae TaxID=1670831 RepID=A0A411YCJ8_9ACTN|nr:thioredoxin domain-containing protein [Egibacter rhizosphaerae]QBI18916.1 thioredoxin domain-containing protein [Egibacter rhizosphaerae]
MANRLADSASPYLQQHAENPVDWFEWGDDAFARAREEDKPVFLSVGYAACHWCHVMAHESFEDAEIAQALNDRFVSIKVDREERPDVDAVYMDAVQAMTGHGGWPMSVFLTPDGRPFFAGTYWPKAERHGMPSFPRVLDAAHEAWTNQRDQVEESAGRVTDHLQSLQHLEPTEDTIDAGLSAQAAQQAAQAWDERHGGFGSAPKFPHAMTVDFLLAHHVRAGGDTSLRVATHTLDAMARGGIHDQVGGGFARYAVDAQWIVPHFEKMLYDNALLLRAYTHAWQVTGAPRYARVVRETAAFLLTELRHPEGAFYSSLDADSPGHATHEGGEGAFYVWTEDEFRDVVAEAGADPDRWSAYFGVSREGNFEGGTTVLRELVDPAAGQPDDPAGDPAHEDAREVVRGALAARRAARPRPGRDEKVLASWNGLVIGALADAGAALDEPAWVTAARDAATFLAERLVVDGRLRHSWKQGHEPIPQTFAEDVACVAQGVLRLYEADHDPRWVGWAEELVADAVDRFADRDTSGAYHLTPNDGEPLVTRPKELWDNAVPAPASALADAGLRLAALTGDPVHAERGEATLQLFAGRAAQVPTGYGELLTAVERRLGGPQEVAIVGTADEANTVELRARYRARWRPGSVLALGEPDDAGKVVPLLAGRPRIDGTPTAYVCRNFACEAPTTDPSELSRQLGDDAPTAYPEDR